MSDETTDLLPCPFSGNCIWEPFSVKWTNCLGDVSYSATVICEACNRGIKCEIRTESAGYKTPEEAKAAIVAILNSRSYDKEAKEMTDNRTTELLHKLLDERGVKYETDADECCYDEHPSTTWDFNLCGLKMTVTAKEFVDTEGKTYLEMDFHHAFTPEQAIAATLGSDASTVRFAERLRSISDEMRHIGASTMTPHELLAFYASEVDKVADLLMFAATLRTAR